LKAWNEQKELLNTLVITQFESKDKEISLLKNHVEILQKELNNMKENYQKDIDNILKSVETQLGLVKDRELFTVSQLVELEERFNNLKQEKERITQLLKEENEELKNQNRVLSKLRGDSTTIQSKSTLSEIKK
jgi:chromosome segregation ATPase